MLDPAIRSTLETCLGALRQGDEAAFVGCFQESAEGYTPTLGEFQGPQGAAQALSEMHARLPGLRLELLRSYGDGPEMAVRASLLSGGLEAEGLFAFRFDREGRIIRFIAFWEPVDRLDLGAAHLGPAERTAVEYYFSTYNEDDEAAHFDLISPDLVYFGAVSRMTAEGLETARGIFRSARDRMGLKRLEPLCVFGRGPHLAVLARMEGSGAGGPRDEGVWIFRLNAQHRFDRVSVLWNPGTFLTWSHR